MNLKCFNCNYSDQNNFITKNSIIWCGNCGSLEIPSVNPEEDSLFSPDQTHQLNTLIDSNWWYSGCFAFNSIPTHHICNDQKEHIAVRSYPIGLCSLHRKIKSEENDYWFDYLDILNLQYYIHVINNAKRK